MGAIHLYGLASPLSIYRIARSRCHLPVCVVVNRPCTLHPPSAPGVDKLFDNEQGGKPDVEEEKEDSANECKRLRFLGSDCPVCSMQKVGIREENIAVVFVGRPSLVEGVDGGC